MMRPVLAANVRSTTRVIAAGLLALTLTLALHASAQPAPADDADTPKLEDTPKLSVRGEAELRKPADQVQINMGVVNDDAEAAAALKENSDRMTAVIKAIKRLGLTDKEYETGLFRIRPNYSRRPRQADSDWEPQIIGYRVTNSVTIRTKKLDLTGAIIEAGNKAGANQVEVAGFDLSNPRQHRSEAIRVATMNAITDARDLAEAAGLDLVRIVTITLDHTPVRTTDGVYATGARAMADAGAAPPVNPGDVTVRAGVTIVYEIAPAQ